MFLLLSLLWLFVKVVIIIQMIYVVFVIVFVVAVFVAIVVAWAETSFIPTAISSSLELFNLDKIIHM